MAEEEGEVLYAQEAPQDAPTGYRESADHVPDPTAMSGTLETSGTGGGHNERITGMTPIFGDLERTVVIRNPVTATEGPAEVVEGEDTPDLVPPQDPGNPEPKTPEKPPADDGDGDESGEEEAPAPVKKAAPARKTAAKKTAAKPQQ